MNRTWWMTIALCAGAGCGITEEVDATSTVARKQDPATVDPVLDWNLTAQQTIVGVAAQPPMVAHRWTGLMHLAMYDAVNAIGGAGGRYEPFAVHVTPRHPASREAAAVSAAYHVLVALLPAQKATFDAKYAASLASIEPGKKRDNGIAMGAEAASLILAQFPPATPPSTYVLPTPGPGAWQPLPPAFAVLQPGFANTVPFTMTSPSQFRAPPPPSLTSATWTADYNETKDYGGVTGLANAYQQETGRLYGIEAPTPQYARITRRIAAEHHLSFSENVRLFAMMYTASTDSQIAAWDSKYHYSFWRPTTAINRGDTDGNDATVADPTWAPLTPTPGHPEYPAAHGTFTGAFTAVLAYYFGTEDLHVVIDSASTGAAHEFNDLEAVRDDIVVGRVYGGMHFRNSVEVGLGIGQQIVDQLVENHFQRLDDCSARVADDEDRVGLAPPEDDAILGAWAD